MEFRRGLAVGRRVAAVSRREQLTLLAAGVAYYAFVSLVPLSLLGLVVVTSIGGDVLATRATTVASNVLTPSARTLLSDALTEDAGRGGATIVGVVTLLWSGTRVLRGLDRAFSQIYGTVGTQGIVGNLGDAAVVTVAVVVGLGIVTAIETALVIAPGAVLRVVAPALVLLAFVLAFWPLYVVFPDAPIDPREALPGTVVAAVGWLLLSWTFGIYAGLAGTYALYGALGAVLLVLAWLYVGAVLVVLGAVVNAVLAGRVPDRQVQHPGRRQVPTGAMSEDVTGPDEGSADDEREGGVDDGGRAAGVDDDGRSAGVDGGGGRGAGDDGVVGSTGRHTSRTRDRSHDPEALYEEIERLRDDLESFERDVDERTVERDSLEGELKRYVRGRVRRGHARGWGPYLVLLYGTAMTIGAFAFLEGGWAILAMFVVWTSTIGVYVLMVLFGAGVSLLNVPGRVRDAVGGWRS